MAEIKVPELAESITEGTVVKWLKAPGDKVYKGDYVVELETDKVNVEIVSDYDGVLESVKYLEGDTVKVGETIATLTAEDEPIVEKTKEEEVQKSLGEPRERSPFSLRGSLHLLRREKRHEKKELI